MRKRILSQILPELSRKPENKSAKINTEKQSQEKVYLKFIHHKKTQSVKRARIWKPIR